MKYKLSDLFELQMGKTPDRSQKKYWDNGIKDWISIADISGCDKYICNTKEKISVVAEKETGIKIIPKNTVIMSFKLSIGKVAITSKGMYSNEAIMAFIDKKVEEIDKEYLYYMFSGMNWDTGTNKAVMGKTLNKATLSQQKIKLHSAIEQAKIVKNLKVLTDVINMRRQQLLALNNLIKSRFVEMFGDPITNENDWEHGTIRDVVKEVKYGTSKPASENGEYPYLRMNNITYEGQLDTSNLKYINISDDEIEKFIVRKGDILFNRTNSKELVGKTCVFDLDMPMVIAGYIIRIRLNELANPVYISAVFNSDYGKLTLGLMCKSIIGQANINAQELQGIKILIPPIDLQNQFADFVQQVDKSKLLYKSPWIKHKNYSIA